MYFFLIIATPFRKKGYMTDYNVTFSQLVFSYYVPPFLHNPKRNSFHYVTTFQNKKKGFFEHLFYSGCFICRYTN